MNGTGGIGRQLLRLAARAAARAGAQIGARVQDRAGGHAGEAAAEHTGTGTPVVYHPEADGEPDPGEVVWAWVPYEDDPSRGKDRPVLVIGVDGDGVTALMLTSKDHDKDAADEARHGRRWMDIGSGGWDRRGRPSEVRLDRLLRLDVAAIRREGAALDRPLFEQVISAL